MPYPHLFAHFIHSLCHLQDVVIFQACKHLMSLIVYFLYIKHNKICILHQYFKLFKKIIILAKRSSGSIKAGIHTVFLTKLKKFRHKIYLQKRLTSAYSNSAVILPVRPVPYSLIKNLFCTEALIFLGRPCIRIVAKLTSHRATLYKYYKSYSRSVHKSECFK